jgi:hypothetical protein
VLSAENYFFESLNFKILEICRLVPFLSDLLPIHSIQELLGFPKRDLAGVSFIVKTTHPQGQIISKT